MKIIVAFDSFKGCMTASEACETARQGLAIAYPDAAIICIPMSDGGEGLVECICNTLSAKWVEVEVNDPRMKPVTAHYAISRDGKIAYMEMAEAAGMSIVPKKEINLLTATTFGVGEMIEDAYKKGCNEIVMGIGGSATCDGGQGMIECFREHGTLEKIREKLKIRVASDVNNPLLGEKGAARVFAPQKGATLEQVDLLENCLQNFVQTTIESDIATSGIELIPGTGAAGGLGYALMAYLGASIESGIELVMNILNFDSQIQGADFILTGEGKSDRQTLMGKVASGILNRARKQKIHCHLLSGQIEDWNDLIKAGFTSVRSINENDGRPIEILIEKEISMKNLKHSILNTNYSLYK